MVANVSGYDDSEFHAVINGKSYRVVVKPEEPCPECGEMNPLTGAVRGSLCLDCAYDEQEERWEARAMGACDES